MMSVVDGLEALTLTTAAGGGIEAAFVPSAGMVGCSLRHRGDELLGQRGGLARYVAERGTMGIPLLHPWANRLAKTRFAVAGREVNLDSAEDLARDPNGQPIHGLLAAAPDWEVERHEPFGDPALLLAAFDFTRNESLMQAFPFAHILRTRITLSGPTLAISTRLEPKAEAVPVAFGYHPYLQLPGVPRAEWQVEIPVRERLAVDSLMLPTGERERVSVPGGPLGTRTFDDGFLAPEGGAPFALAGGDRRIDVSFGAGYGFAQIYAPADDDVVAYEPMTAPTNALVTGEDLPVVQPGESYEATFSITVA